jgi:hypothetical protein
VTLRFIATDYLRHLLHHLGQIGVDGSALKTAGIAAP